MGGYGSSEQHHSHTTTIVKKERPITINIPEKYLNEPDIANILQQKAHELCERKYKFKYPSNWYYDNGLNILGRFEIQNYFESKRIKSKDDIPDVQPTNTHGSLVFHKCNLLKWGSYNCNMLRQYMKCETYSPKYPKDNVLSRLCQNSHMDWEKNKYLPIEYHTKQILKHTDDLDEIDLKFESQKVINILNDRREKTIKEMMDEYKGTKST